MDTFIQYTVDALTLGSVYALIALGYTLVYGVLKLLNFAHGDVFMVGTFVGYGVLKKAGVTTVRLSAPNTTTDYSAYVTKVPNDADIVFFPTQKPADAQTFAQQLLEQGKKAKVFGGDGSNDSSQFKAPGSYVSNFAPDITSIPADAKLVAGWKKDNPGKAVGSFGPPAYGAVQIALNAIKLACTQGHGTATRVAVFHNMKKVRIPNWILGGSFKWSTKSNDPLNAKFYIFQIQSNGAYKLVG